MRLWSSAWQIFSWANGCFGRSKGWIDTGPGVRVYLTAEFGGKLWALFQTRCLEIPSVKEALLHLSRREKDVVIVAYWPGAKLFYREFGGGGRPFGGLISKPPPQVNKRCLLLHPYHRERKLISFWKCQITDIIWSHKIKFFFYILSSSLLSLSMVCNEENRIIQNKQCSWSSSFASHQSSLIILCLFIVCLSPAPYFPIPFLSSSWRWLSLVAQSLAGLSLLASI